MNVSIVIPVFNESGTVEELYYSIEKELSKYGLTYEIIFVDDGSTDGTWNVIERLKMMSPHLKGIKLKRNYGQTNAMVAGFDQAGGSVIVTLDGDMQNDPSDIHVLLEKLDEGYDIVSGWRKDRKDSFLRVIPSRVANAIISFTTGVKLHDYGCTAKAYRSECIKPINAYGEMHRFLPALASMTGAKVTEMPVNHFPRKHGSSKYGFERIFNVFSDILALNLIISFSSAPLKGFVLCALPFLILAFGFGILSVLAILLGWTEGKSTVFLLSTALNFMAVFHLVALGVLGELVVSTSDLSHTQMPEVSKKAIKINGEPE
jgi:glycosyltransferase involved in cell wall biosynthesis